MTQVYDCRSTSKTAHYLIRSTFQMLWPSNTKNNLMGSLDLHDEDMGKKDLS